jgi:hypothetical protein
MLLLLLCFLIAGPALGQTEESYLDVFQRTLLESFIGPLQADEKDITREQRAIFMGYILNRQDSHIGHFETDRLRQEKLVAEVRDFLAAISPDRDLWPFVEAGRSGSHKNEVDEMLGGSPFVAPIFPSLKTITQQWNELEYSYDRFQNHPRKQEALRTAQNFLLALRGLRYEEAKSYLGGRFYEEFTAWLIQIQTNPEEKAKVEAYFSSLEWMSGMNEMADTDPPFARILHTLPDREGNWDEHWCYMILDNGAWKIVRFFF